MIKVKFVKIGVPLNGEQLYHDPASDIRHELVRALLAEERKKYQAALDKSTIDCLVGPFGRVMPS